MVPVWVWGIIGATCTMPTLRAQEGSSASAVPASVLASVVRPAVDAPLPSLSPAALAGDRTTRQVSVTFWNVQWFPGHKPGAGVRAQNNHVALVLPVVQRLNPDVLGLEECGDASAARRLTDGMSGFRVDACTEFTRAPNDEPSRQQVVLCSRLPLLIAGWQRFQADPRGLVPRRGFAFAAYQSSPGEVLLVYGLHLKSNVEDEPGGEVTNTAMREESMRQVLLHQRAEAAACAKWGRVRLAVVGGDMNTSLDDPRFEQETTLRTLLSADGGFLWVWQGIPEPLRLSMPGGGPYPPACFDHIFYKGTGVRLVAAAIEPTARNVSDHHPVSARFEW